ncbi:50S ribosomal protein L18e [Candidatus Woesearchaeota archaeon]|nr:50S ribosomal protein L18e [Candidatus Woesearchaeota archaeon]
MKRTTNQHLQTLIADLRKHSYTNEASLWKRLADDLAKPSRQRRIVNINHLNRITHENETIVVPGKVLGAGVLNHSITVAAWNFSSTAKEGIEKAKGKCLSLPELMKQNPKAQKVRIIG